MATMAELPTSLIHEMETHRVVDYQAIRRWDDGHDVEYNFLLMSGSWQYRGEGNSNIVLAVEEGVQVIRLPKVKLGDHPTSNDWIRQRKNLEREVVFANKVFGRLIGLEFIGTVQIVKLSLAQINDLNVCLKDIRPANRLHKELGVPYATSHTDFARIYSNPSEHMTYCVEIKPKQGWWTKTILGDSTNLCTFCLNQFLKLKTGKVTGFSAYCPLDLFSGDPLRIVGALFALIKTPQNNFRIFRNGELVYGDNFGDSESLGAILQEWLSTCENVGAVSSLSTEKERNLLNFVYILSTSLLKPQNTEANGVTPKVGPIQVFDNLKVKTRNILLQSFRNYANEKKEKDCNAEIRELPEGSILFRILQAQKLGKWGSGSIYKLYPKICPYHAPESSVIEDSVCCPSRACLVDDKWLDEIQSNTLTELDVLCIEHYLLAATAKDCSIMLTFSPLDSAEGDGDGSRKGTIQDLNGNQHRIKIGVADLDPKPVTSIARHYIRDVDMLEAYRRLVLST